jgi:hypothetical protein
LKRLDKKIKEELIHPNSHTSKQEEKILKMQFEDLEESIKNFKT